MKTTVALCALAFGIVLGTPPLPAATPEEIVRQASKVTGLTPDAAPLEAKLGAEVARIIQAGHLMPFRAQYGEGSPRYFYAEPWMMMYTLALTYPYLPADLQKKCVEYVSADTKLQVPWSEKALELKGFPRQPDAPDKLPAEGRGNYRVRGALFYALWRWGTATGDWKDIQAEWNGLKTLYAKVRGGRKTYELLNGALAMARLARTFGDAQAADYEKDAVQLLQEGLDYRAFRANSIADYTGRDEWERGSYGMLYPLFHLTPEVARWIKGNEALRAAVEKDVYTQPESQSAIGVGQPTSGLWTWPLWFMAQAPVGHAGYYGEGCCADPCSRLMLFNYMAWVREEPKEKLRYYLDVPDALVGDCYFIQNLVTTLEAHGTRAWAP